MNLYEYQAKTLFSEFNLPVLKGVVCSKISEVERCILDLNSPAPWAIKCQVYSGGRGKSGGILITSSLKEVFYFVKKNLGKRLITYQSDKFGEIVKYILIESAVKIIHEFYFSICIDRDTEKVVCIVSTHGGINIENKLQQSPNIIYKIDIDPSLRAHPYQGRILAHKLGLNAIQMSKFVDIYINMTHMFLDKDLTLSEINPLAVTENHDLICLDAKVIVDHNALFRQKKLLNLYSDSYTQQDLSFNINHVDDLNYISLDGNIGCMVNGAGLAMATMDLMKSLGGMPANFLDIGGDTNERSVELALKIILDNIKVKAIFINIFGGIVCCNLIADCIVAVLFNCTNHVPVVVRLEGNNSTLGSNKLMNSNLCNITVINNLFHAIQHVITLVK